MIKSYQCNQMDLLGELQQFNNLNDNDRSFACVCVPLWFPCLPLPF